MASNPYHIVPVAPIKTMARPNFLLFITDQQQAAHLGAYGNRIVRTPNLDKLAEHGWVADRCYVAAPICMPNRAALITGRMPSVNGVRHNGIPLSLLETTFVDRLRGHGYRTALIGKSHLQNMSGLPAPWPGRAAGATSGEARNPGAGRYDQEWGPSWDENPDFDVLRPYYGFEHVDLVVDHGDIAGGHYRRWLQRNHPEAASVVGPEHAISSPEYELSGVGQAWRSRIPEELSTTSYIARQACSLLSQYARTGQSFFMKCSFPDPHHPFTPPGKYWNMYAPEDIELPDSFHGELKGALPHIMTLRSARDAGHAVKNTPAMFACTEREAREAIALNYGSITHIDDAIGTVLKELDASGLRDDTIVLFTSDHGDFMGDHQLLFKGPIHYQSLIRVPLIVNSRRFQPGRSSQLHSTIDLAPTILDLAGCVACNGIQGRSLVPEFQQSSQPGRSALVIEEENQRTLPGAAYRTRMRTLQTPRYRLSAYEAAAWGELYDLHEDPQELDNLWDDPGYRDLRGHLLETLVREMITLSETSPNPTALA